MTYTKTPEEVIHKMYIDVANHIGETLSRDSKRKVCAIAVKNNSILGYGVNGTPNGWATNEIPTDYNGKTIHTNVVHAEINLIAKLARQGQATEGATMYVTDQPCAECAKAIRQAGFKAVYYEHDYKNDDGRHVLTSGLHSQVQLTKVQ